MAKKIATPANVLILISVLHPFRSNRATPLRHMITLAQTLALFKIGVT